MTYYVSSGTLNLTKLNSTTAMTVFMRCDDSHSLNSEHVWVRRGWNSSFWTAMSTIWLRWGVSLVILAPFTQVLTHTVVNCWLTDWPSEKDTLNIQGSHCLAHKKIPRLLHDHWNVFPGLCRSLAMLNYRQTAVTYFVYTVWQYNPLQNVHHKLQKNCPVSTQQKYVTHHTFIYNTWCSINKRHVG